jgi:hypothetical protein
MVSRLQRADDVHRLLRGFRGTLMERPAEPVPEQALLWQRQQPGNGIDRRRSIVLTAMLEIA